MLLFFVLRCLVLYRIRHLLTLLYSSSILSNTKSLHTHSWSSSFSYCCCVRFLVVFCVCALLNLRTFFFSFPLLGNIDFLTLIPLWATFPLCHIFLCCHQQLISKPMKLSFSPSCHHRLPITHSHFCSLVRYIAERAVWLRIWHLRHCPASLIKPRVPGEGGEEERWSCQVVNNTRQLTELSGGDSGWLTGSKSYVDKTFTQLGFWAPIASSLKDVHSNYVNLDVL